ncbi:hypothetical protein LX36DRAFT_664954 [Colletotrichum falcatum]|nr:hypothetical protein LX36DRAFT_664954 [Colletotrichum falcatum]
MGMEGTGNPGPAFPPQKKKERKKETDGPPQSNCQRAFSVAGHVSIPACSSRLFDFQPNYLHALSRTALTKSSLLARCT